MSNKITIDTATFEELKNYYDNKLNIDKTIYNKFFNHFLFNTKNI